MKRVYGSRVSDNGLLEAKYINTTISFDDYFTVQNEKGKRSSIDEDTNKRKATQYYSKDVLSGLFICAECGGVYWRITRPSGEIVWRCSNRVKHGKAVCHHAPSLPQSELKQAVCAMLEIPEFDSRAVKENLEYVQVLSDGTLIPEFIQRSYQELRL